MQLASSCFGHVNQIRRERPLTREELMYHVPSIFGEDRHTSRSETVCVVHSYHHRPGKTAASFQPALRVICQDDKKRLEYTKTLPNCRRWAGDT